MWHLRGLVSGVELQLFGQGEPTDDRKIVEDCLCNVLSDTKLFNLDRCLKTFRCAPTNVCIIISSIYEDYRNDSKSTIRTDSMVRDSTISVDILSKP